MNEIQKCCEILGVQAGASPKAVKKAYRDLVKKWHPDRFPFDSPKRKEAEEKTKDINLAFARIREHRAALIARESTSLVPKPAPPRPRPTESRPPRPKPAPPSTTKRAPAAATSEPKKSRGPKTRASPSAPARSATVSWIDRLFRPAPVLIAVTGLVAVVTGIAVFMPGEPPRSSRGSGRESVVRPSGEAPLRAMGPDEFSTASEASGVQSPAETQGTSPRNSAPLTSSTTSTSASSSIRDSAAPDPASRNRPDPSITSGGTGSTLASATSSQPAPTADGIISTPQPASRSTPRLISESLKAKLTAAPEPSTPPEPSFEATPEGQFRMGLRHANGDGVPQDYAEAARWYRLAADAAHAGAQKNLGFLYAAGKGVTQDPDEAEKWFRKAGAGGSAGASFAGGLLALARTNLGERPRLPNASSSPSSPRVEQAGTETRRGGTNEHAPHPSNPLLHPLEDKEKLKSLIQPRPRSPLLTGLTLTNATTTKPAVPVPARASEPKDPEGQYALGLRYATGDGLERDYEAAAKWYRLAAEGGHAVAQKNLGLLYASGKGVAQDYAEAEKWLRQAAAKGLVGVAVPKAAVSSTNASAESVAEEPAKENP